MSLQDWLNNGWLIEHRSSKAEINDLLDAVERDLSDCQTPDLSTDWRFNIAYNAALQAATAALAAEGYRAEREQHHFRVIQSLSFTIGAGADHVDRFNRFRKKRNMGVYERAGVVSDHEADQMIELAEEIRGQVKKWLKEKHPLLVTK